MAIDVGHWFQVFPHEASSKPFFFDLFNSDQLCILGMISKIMKSLTFPSKSAIGKLIHLKGK